MVTDDLSDFIDVLIGGVVDLPSDPGDLMPENICGSSASCRLLQHLLPISPDFQVTIDGILVKTSHMLNRQNGNQNVRTTCKNSSISVLMSVQVGYVSGRGTDARDVTGGNYGDLKVTIGNLCCSNDT